MKLIFVTLTLFGMLFYSVTSWGYVCSVEYGWFILSSFPTFIHFTVLQFMGFIMFLSCVMSQHTYFYKDDIEDKELGIVMFFINPWLTLFFGWVVKLIFF